MPRSEKEHRPHLRRGARGGEYYIRRGRRVYVTSQRSDEYRRYGGGKHAGRDVHSHPQRQNDRHGGHATQWTSSPAPNVHWHAARPTQTFSPAMPSVHWHTTPMMMSGGVGDSQYETGALPPEDLKLVRFWCNGYRGTCPIWKVAGSIEAWREAKTFDDAKNLMSAFTQNKLFLPMYSGYFVARDKSDTDNPLITAEKASRFSTLNLLGLITTNSQEGSFEPAKGFMQRAYVQGLMLAAEAEFMLLHVNRTSGLFGYSYANKTYEMSKAAMPYRMHDAWVTSGPTGASTSVNILSNDVSDLGVWASKELVQRLLQPDVVVVTVVDTITSRNTLIDQLIAILQSLRSAKAQSSAAPAPASTAASTAASSL